MRSLSAIRSLLLVTILLAFGCSSGESSVTGRVTYQGKPLVVGTVTLHFDDNNVFSGGISPDGTYYIPAAARGHGRVAVISPKPAPAVVLPARGEAPSPSADPVIDPNKWFEIPAKYGSPETSGKEVTVGSGKNVIDIKLE